MSIRIEVKSANVHENSGTAKATGKPYTIRKQTAWAHVVDQDGKQYDFPARIEIQLDSDQTPYAVGNYTIAPSSFFVGEFDKLAMRRLNLVAVRAAA
jgi:hypothetical protein